MDTLAVVGNEDNFGDKFKKSGPGPRDVALWMAVQVELLSNIFFLHH
jgi:hypothetical protein